MLVEEPGDAVEIVEAGDERQPDDRVRDAGAGRGLRGLSGRAHLVGLGRDRHLHRVVMAVVAALHLDDQVAPGDRPHQVDGVHRRLGAGVGEAPQRQAEPPGELARHHQRILGGLGEMGAAGDLAADRLDDRRVGVAGQGRAVPAVQVHVLVAVDVVDLGAAAMAEPDRLRGGDLPARGDSARQRVPRPGGHAGRLRLALREDPLLLRDDTPQVNGRPRREVLRRAVLPAARRAVLLAGHDALPD